MEGPGSGDSGSPRGDAPALLPPAPPALPAPSAGDPAAPLSPPPPPRRPLDPQVGWSGRIWLRTPTAPPAGRWSAATGSPARPGAPAAVPLCRRPYSRGWEFGCPGADEASPPAAACSAGRWGERQGLGPRDWPPSPSERWLGCRRPSRLWPRSLVVVLLWPARPGPAGRAAAASCRLPRALPALPLSPLHYFLRLLKTVLLDVSPSPCLASPPPSPAIGRLTRAGGGWGCPSWAHAASSPPRPLLVCILLLPPPVPVAPPSPPPAAAPPPIPMTRDWGDGSGRPKRPLEESRATSRASPDGNRREVNLRRQLTSQEPRRSPARDARRSRSPPATPGAPLRAIRAVPRPVLTGAPRRAEMAGAPRSGMWTGALPPRRAAATAPAPLRPSVVVAARRRPPGRSPLAPRRPLRAPTSPPATNQACLPARGALGLGLAKIECPNLPMCYLCKGSSHPAALCPDRPVSEELMMYGHGIEGLGFFHIEVEDVPPPSPSLLAVVTIDWQVTPTSDSSFTVVFPDALSLGLCTRSDDITLALNKLVVNISEPLMDPKAVAVLDTTWILIASLPDIARSEKVICSMSKLLGKVVVVDELSLRKEEEVRVKVKCLDSSTLRATVRVFFNDQGFDLKIYPEPPKHIGRPRRFTEDHFAGGSADHRDDSHYRRPRPSRHEDPEDDDERSGCSRSPSPIPSDPPPGRGHSGAGRLRGLASVEVAPAALPDSSPSSSAELSDISSVSLIVLPASSSRSPCLSTEAAPPPPPPTVASPLLSGSPALDPAPLGSAPADPPGEDPPSPPASPPASAPAPVADLPAPDPPSLDLAGSDALLAPPAPASPPRLLLVHSADVASPVASHPPRSVPYVRRARASSTPVTASRRSARLDTDRPAGLPVPSISERAEIRAAARNLETGASDTPSSSSFCSFSALEAIPQGRLAKLDSLSSHLFAWHWLPSSGNNGHSGGILLGVKDATFEVGGMDRGEFFISMEIFERALNFKWEVIIVYGPADHNRSPTFLAELQQKISASPLPVVVGGDFNLFRSPDEKNNDRVNRPRMQMFNDCIAELGLRELERTGARFTWTNRQANPT
nr:proline-rich protein 36-like [Aegilops tauschii subsp. strangulata]